MARMRLLGMAAMQLGRIVAKATCPTCAMGAIQCQIFVVVLRTQEITPRKRGYDYLIPFRICAITSTVQPLPIDLYLWLSETALV